MSERIIASSVLEVKATAALSQEIAKDLQSTAEEKNMEEIIENQRTFGDDRSGSVRSYTDGVQPSKK